ncbi:MAG: hypothetical protein ED859_15250 [Desulfuromonadales bacterium]|nr:MAG: hypothetical protein ED859_15250 [Desulfuromonadales bacterium]
MDQQPIEMIDLATFAERMGIAESTAWKWIRNGKLKPGRHFIKLDRIIRFAWGQELINRLMEDCQEIDENDPSQEGSKRRHPVRNGQGAINITY